MLIKEVGVGAVVVVGFDVRGSVEEGRSHK